MGVALSYTCEDQMDDAERQSLVAAVSAKNSAFKWWAESIHFGADKSAQSGWTKLFRVIPDVNTDLDMAQWDMREIIQFFVEQTKTSGHSWAFSVEGQFLGRVAYGAPDDELETNLAGFGEGLEVAFPEELEALRSKSREEIMAEWPDL